MSASEVHSEFRVWSRDGVREVWLPMGSGEPEPSLLASSGLNLLAHARQLDEHLLHGVELQILRVTGSKEGLESCSRLGRLAAGHGTRAGAPHLPGGGDRVYGAFPSLSWRLCWPQADCTWPVLTHWPWKTSPLPKHSIVF